MEIIKKADQMKAELFLTFDEDQLQRVIGILNKHNIPYRIQTDNFGSSNRGSRLLGGWGENNSYRAMHYVYVSKKDLGLARSCIFPGDGI